MKFLINFVALDVSADAFPRHVSWRYMVWSMKFLRNMRMAKGWFLDVLLDFRIEVV